MANGNTVTDVACDRGYSCCVALSWALPLWERRIVQIFDLYTNQRGVHPGPIPGTIWLDGGLFADAVPERLRALPIVTRNMPAETKARIHAMYDERAAWAYTPMGARDERTGAQRFRGPALRGALSCANNGKSMRSKTDRPLTNCVTGQPCGCSSTITLGPEAAHLPRDRQNPLWATTRWAASYGRRNGIESANAELKTHRALIVRRFTRVFGTVKNAILLAFAYAGVNQRILHAWHAKRLIPDPWVDLLNEPAPVLDPPRRRPDKRTRKPRRVSLHQVIAGRHLP